MQNHNHVLMSLEMEFKRMDRMFASGEARVFGRDTERIFRELDVIRRKQIDLARDHIALENITDLPQKQSTLQQFSENNEIEHGYQQNLENFHKKEVGLKNLMLKLDDLGASMNRFRELSDPEMHYYNNHGYDSQHRANAAQFEFMGFDDVESPLSTPRQEHHPAEPLSIDAFAQSDSQSSSRSNIVMED
ncbi:hypothetical protein BDB00DRAFT_852739 [Zychaea mexicana]|uniref:uncharacterized protein n=1 Tax=Zychaea mexicana TaxID=64656 RepID=UPI0022FF424C|nr:uncharacterized protein BDB00DRAFT_852739 [Zychaea mexicana]KAI9484892.1 hypothetical protein BDB00DRAFT_852739 [Zychaea mexicana]